MADRDIDFVGARVSDSISAIEKTHWSSHVELIEVYADPIIKKILSYRLNFYLSSGGRGLNQPEAEDLYQTVVLKLISCLGAGGEEMMVQGSDRINSYVAAITHNVCNDFLRMK